MFEFNRLYTLEEKEQFIQNLVVSMLENKGAFSYEDAIDKVSEKMEKVMTKDAFEDLVEHIVVDHTNYYDVAKKVAGEIVKRNGNLTGEGLEEVLSDFGIDRYDLPKEFVEQYFSES